MSLNAEALRLMQAKGLTLDDVVEIAAAMESRSKGAERQAAYRQRKRQKSDVTRDVTPPPPNEVYSNPPPSSPNVISNEITPPAENQNDPGLKPEHVVEAWNAMAERVGLRTVRKFTPDRRRKLSTRIRQSTIEDFTEAIGAVERCAFLRGENDRGWKAHFDWVLEPKNFTKLIEGTYDR